MSLSSCSNGHDCDLLLVIVLTDRRSLLQRSTESTAADRETIMLLMTWQSLLVSIKDRNQEPGCMPFHVVPTMCLRLEDEYPEFAVGLHLGTTCMEYSYQWQQEVDSMGRIFGGVRGNQTAKTCWIDIIYALTSTHVLCACRMMVMMMVKNLMVIWWWCGDLGSLWCANTLHHHIGSIRLSMLLVMLQQIAPQLHV